MSCLLLSLKKKKVDCNKCMFNAISVTTNNVLCFLLGVCAGGNLAFSIFYFLKQKFSVICVQKSFGNPILLGALQTRGNNSY